MNIALDFDGTFTAAPQAYLQAIDVFQLMGHKVYVVTMRYPQESLEIVQALTGIVNGVFFTRRQAKVPYMQRNHPEIKIDNWWDDSPHWLLNDAL